MVEVYRVLPIVVSCALVDSVNPCTFAVLTALLLITLHISGRRRAALSGIAFVSAVYLAYFLVGLNLVRVVGVHSAVRYAIGALGLAMGSYTLANSVRGAGGGPIPKFVKDEVSKLIVRATTVPLAFSIGIIVSISLLPCSAGPYLIALYYVSGLPFAYSILLLATYNAIFVLPLVGIVALTVAVGKLARKVKRCRGRAIKVLSALEGALLIGLATYLLVLG